MFHTKKCLSSLVLAALFSALPYQITFAEEKTAAEQAYIVDFETGQVLFDKNSDVQMPTSSMSKTITAYVLFDALKAGQYRRDDTFRVSKKAWKKGGSKMFIEVGKDIQIEDLLRGLIVQSGNDAAICIAEGVAGTEEGFADLLNKKARELGMDNSHFANASGWPDPEHYSTARDLGVLGRALIHNHPEFYKIYSEKEFKFSNIKQGNRNPLLYRNIGADGIKTGHTEDGGYGLIGSAQADGRRVVVVLNGMASVQERANESARLTSWALRSFENIALYKSGASLVEAETVYGENPIVSLVTAEDVVFTVPKYEKDKIKIRVHYDSPIVAPVSKGDRQGELEVVLPDGRSSVFPLLAGHDVAEQGGIAKIMTKLGLLLTGGK